MKEVTREMIKLYNIKKLGYDFADRYTDKYCVPQMVQH